MPHRETPYKGLVPYDEEDAEFFFGRDSQRDIIIGNLMASRLTLLYGPSGVGKSSVLRAGVEHQLRLLIEQNLRERGVPDFGFVVFNSWRDDPVRAIADRIDRNLSTLVGPEKLTPSPERSAEDLVEFLRAWSRQLNGDIYLILDQFEEYFLYHPRDDDAKTFGAQFVRAVNQSDLRVNFLISIREDSYAKLDRFKGRIPKLFYNYLRIDHLNREAAELAIRGPVEKYNEMLPADESPVTIEPELVEAVLEQVRAGRLSLGETGGGRVESEATNDLIETPYLQLVMTRLWDEEMAIGSRVLRLATLQGLGNAERIVRTHLDKTMESFSAEEQEIAARAFHYLVTPSGTKIAYYPKDLARYTGLPENELTPILEKLAGGSVLILRKVSVTTNPNAPPRFEVFHDVLANAMLAWTRRFSLNREFLKDTIGEGQKQLSRRRLKIGGDIATLLLLIFAVWAGIASYENSKKARSLELAAAAGQNRLDALGLLLAKEAVEQMSTPEAEAALRDSMRVYPGLLTLKDSGHITAAAISPKGSYVVTGLDDGGVHVWNGQDGKRVKADLTALSGIIRFVVFSHNGSFMVTVSQGSNLLPRIQVCETATFKECSAIDLEAPPSIVDNQVTSVEFSRDDKYLVAGSADHQARIWATNSLRDPAILQHPAGVAFAHFNPNGNALVTADTLGTVRLWKWEPSASSTVLFEFKSSTPTATFSPDGTEVALADAYGEIRLFDAVSGAAKSFVKKLEGGAFGMAFSNDGKRLSSFGGSGIRVWDLKTGNLVIENDAFEVNSRHTVFSPNRTQILIAHRDQAQIVFLGCLCEGCMCERSRIVLDQQRTEFIQFSPEGEIVLTTSENTARVWRVMYGSSWHWEENAPIRSLLDAVEGRTGRDLTPDERSRYRL